MWNAKAPVCRNWCIHGGKGSPCSGGGQFPLLGNGNACSLGPKCETPVQWLSRAAGLCLVAVRDLWYGRRMTEPTTLETRMGSQIDDYHGETVADPYRWLEDTNDPETRRWIEVQNARPRPTCPRSPPERRSGARLTEDLGLPKVRCALRKGPALVPDAELRACRTNRSCS